jgi:hypothetical protein
MEAAMTLVKVVPKEAWPKCFIQDIVQYKAKVYTTSFFNAVKLPIAV